MTMISDETRLRRAASLHTRSDLGADATKDVAGALNALLADLFALYLKTKNFHWHVSGPHFRDYHLLLDEQADQIFAITDTVAERVRKLGGATLHSIGHIAKLQRIKDNDADFVTPQDMLAELRDDNLRLISQMRETHSLCDERGDVQRMSAGTGVRHSEYNHQRQGVTHFLQIWIVPSKAGVPPSYEQKHFAAAEKRGRLRLVASPDGRDGSVSMNQDALLYAGLF